MSSLGFLIAFKFSSMLGIAAIAVLSVFGCGGEGGAEINPVPANAMPNDSGTADAWEGGVVLIDPSKDCTDYPTDKILSEITIAYQAGVPEAPGERDKMKEILTKIPYQITQGILSVTVVDTAIDCTKQGKEIKLGSYFYDTYEIKLCKDLTGQSGAFENFDTLTWVLSHEVGHHLSQKISGHYYAETVHWLMQENSDCNSQNYNECFANVVPTYIYEGPYFKISQPNSYDDTKIFFCNKEYDAMGLCNGYLDLGLFYQKQQKYDRALDNYYKAVNFLNSTCGVGGYYLIGKVYNEQHDCQNAIDAFTRAYNQATKIDERQWLLYWVAKTYEECAHDTASAIIKYNQVIDEFPQSQAACWALEDLYSIYANSPISGPYHWGEFIGSCQQFIGSYSTKDACFAAAYLYLAKAYFFYNECDEASSALNYMFDNLADYLTDDRICIQIGQCLYDSGDCVTAKDILNKYLAYFPNGAYNIDAQNITNQCN